MIAFCIVTIITFFVCDFALIKEKEWNREHGVMANVGDTLAVDLLVFLLIAELPMFVIIFLLLNISNEALWDLWVNSGFMVACSLFVIGNTVKWIYSVLRKSIFSKMNFRDFKNEMTFVFFLVCLMYVTTLVSLRAWKVALAFAAIVIGRFVWFDSTIKSIKEEFIDKYSKITCCPLGTVCAYSCIFVTVSIRNGMFIMAALMGIVMAFAKFIISSRKELWNKKFVLLVVLIVSFLYLFENFWPQIRQVTTKHNLKIACVILISTYFILEIGSLLYLTKHKVLRWLKNWSVVFGVILITLAIPVGIHFKFYSKVTFTQEAFLSAYTEYLSFLGAFALGYYLYKREEIKNFEELKKKARIIYESMLYIQINFENIDFFIEQGEVYPIPDTWRSDYLDIKNLVKHEESELSTELQYFFGRVDSINKAIVSGDKERAKRLYSNFIQKEQHSYTAYNYMDATEVMLCLSLDMPQQKVWKEKDKNQIKKYANDYFDVVNLWVYNYLIKNHLSFCDIDVVKYEIIDWLLQNPEMKAWVKHPYDKRKISAILFEIALSMNERSPNLNYCWREFSLKDGREKDGDS